MADVKTFFSTEEIADIKSAIEGAMSRTSGEIRLRVGKKAGKNPLLSARAAFLELGMRGAAMKNGVLFYVWVEDKKFAVLGDDGIDQKVPEGFWESVKDVVLVKFRQKDFAIGLAGGINMAAEKLAEFFPGEDGTEKNPVDVVSYEE